MLRSISMEDIEAALRDAAERYAEVAKVRGIGIKVKPWMGGSYPVTVEFWDATGTCETFRTPGGVVETRVRRFDIKEAASRRRARERFYAFFEATVAYIQGYQHGCEKTARTHAGST